MSKDRSDKAQSASYILTAAVETSLLRFVEDFIYEYQ